MLYKYTYLNEQFFENRMLRFTEPKYFNDPFEGQVNNVDLLERYKNLDFHIREMSNQILEMGLRQKGIGVLSLSQNKYSLLMWAHYADEYRGMLLEFDPNIRLADNLIEFGNKSTTYAKIEYKNERLSGDYWGVMENNIPVALGRKNEEWGYEKEIRVFCHEDNIDKTIVNKSKPINEKYDSINKINNLLQNIISEEDESEDSMLLSAKENIYSYIKSNEEFNEENQYYLNEEKIWLKTINKRALTSIIIGPLADRWKALEYYLRGILSETIDSNTRLYFSILNPSEYKVYYIEFSETEKILDIFESMDFGMILETKLKIEFPINQYEVNFEERECRKMINF